MINWLHKLFNPHCSACAEKELNSKICESCETLKVQLSIANQEKDRLLQALLDVHKPVAQERVEIRNLQPVSANTLPWKARKQALEAESRREAELIAKNESQIAKKSDTDQQKVEELEKELGLFAEEGA